MVMEPFVRHFPDLGPAGTATLYLRGEPGPDSRFRPANMPCLNATAPSGLRLPARDPERDREGARPCRHHQLWFHRAADMAGPFLDPLNVQSPYAQELMELIERA